MTRRSGSRPSRKKRRTPDDSASAALRIVGGRLRGRTIRYSGDPRTRPMKERVRESVFNLVGPAVVGKHAIDLFAGTGALGLEALSRGAVGATFIERHAPSVRLLEENVAALGVREQSEGVFGDAFLWRRLQPDWPRSVTAPRLVLCSPPYDFYCQRTGDMIQLIRQMHEEAPPSSLLVVEADHRFDFNLLADMGSWDVRNYRPAVVGILRMD